MTKRIAQRIIMLAFALMAGLDVLLFDDYQSAVYSLLWAILLQLLIIEERP